MAYQGNDIELLYIETDQFTFTIKGKPVHPDIEQLSPQQETSLNKALLQVAPINCKIEEFLHFTPHNDLQPYESETVFPFFYEWQDYQVIIESKDGQGLEFYHENKLLREAVTPLSKNQNILTGNLNFRNDVGYSELEVRANGISLLIIKIEVFPSKIDYKTDYQNLLDEVNKEIYNLAYDFLRRTFQEMKLKEEENISHSEFFSILKAIFSNFIKAFKRIKKAPHHNLNKIQQVKPAGRVKKTSRKGIKWLRKNPQFYDYQEGLPQKMLEVNKRVSFNNFENKFVKWMLKQIIKRIKAFLERYENLYQNNIDEQVIEKANLMINKLDFMLTHTFLKDIGELHKIDSLSLVLQMAPGYRELYKYYLMLKKGLSVNGELFRLSMKETWELYEYWCFLKLNQILRKEYNLVKNNLIDVDYSGIYVTLNKSYQAVVEYENPKTGEKFSLAYNSNEGDRVTIGQRPDNVLTLEKEGSDIQYKFVFDAKYRINPAYPNTSYHNKYGTPGPEEETINTMHRYRDAIIHQNRDDFKRTIVGAYVFFPYHNEEEFRKHHFYKSIDRVNVGAFPFLPGSVELVSTFLQNLIEETSVSNYERNLLPIGTKEYQGKMNFEENVLVGSLRRKKQLKIALEQNFYHIPCSRVNLSERQLRYIAIYLSKKKFKDDSGVRYYGEIKGWEVKQRKEIEIPLIRNNGEEPYYVFDINNWQELEEPILPEGYGVSGSHIYTNDMLLFKAKTLPELSIRNLEEWRIWLELSRLKDELKVIIENNKIESATKISGFEVDNVQVKIKNKKIIIIKDKQEIRMNFKRFIKNTRGVMKDLIELNNN